MHRIRNCLIILLGFVALPSFAMEETPARQETRKIMHGIFHAIKTVIPLSLNQKQFTAQANQEKIKEALGNLANSAEVLRRHGKGRNQAFVYLSDRLAHDAKRTYRWYANERFDEARFYLHNIAENCISCHSKLPADKNFPGANEFFSEKEIAQLDTSERVWFEVATRRFDKALDGYETLLRNSKNDFQHLSGSTAFLDYLKVSIRVRNDYDRPAKFIKSLAAKATTPEAKNNLQEMLTSLAVAKSVSNSKIGLLKRGRILVRKAEQDGTNAFDRSPMIYHLAASAQLNQFVDSQPADKTKLSEAYYLLGKTELKIGRTFWISEAEHFWEYAVRVAPNTQWARDSFNLMKEYLTVEFSGSAGTFIPEDVKALLNELQALLDGAKST